jgi:NTP pyrophosphatase (non-canonical NTP hydrolase)
MDLKALQTRLRDFAAARDWQPYHSPKNLAMALMVEAAELLELFQWLTTEQSNTLTRDAADKGRVGDEIADVLLYLLQLADRTGVDVEQAVERKLLKNAQKYPAKHLEKPKQGPKAHLLVDWENVQPKGPELRGLVPDGSDVWLFHGPEQKVDASSHYLTYGASKVILVPRSGAGKNALDFQLSYYMGYISARQPEGRFVVVSNDKGYDAMLEHARELGFDAQRRGFVRPPAPPVALPAKAKVAPATGPRRELASASAPPFVVPVVAPLPASLPSVAQIAWRTIVHLRQLEPQHRPIEQPSWQALIESLIHEPVPDKAALASRACQLVQGRRLGIARAPANEVYARKPLQTPPAPAAAAAAAGAPIVATTARSLSVQPPVAAKKPVAAPKTVSTKPAAKKPATPGKTVPAAKKIAAPQTAAQVAQRVLASLKKMPGNKPARHAGLLKLIQTHITAATKQAVTADQVCSLLEKGKHLSLSQDGLKVTYPKLQYSAQKKAPSA